MTDPQPLPQPFWEDAEALIEHLESAVRSGSSPERLLDEIVTRLRTTANAQTAALAIQRDRSQQTIARSGIAIAAEADSGASSTCQIRSTRQLIPAVTLELTLGFTGPVPLAHRQPLVELNETMLDLASGLVLRMQVIDLQRQHQLRSHRDQWIASLYQGETLQETFSGIAAAIAAEVDVDRVSIVRVDGDQAQWIATSNRTPIDPRSEQVRSLQQVVKTVAVDDRSATFFSAASDLPDVVRGYFDRSGCQALHIDWIGQSRVAVVAERFQPIRDPSALARLLDPIRQPVELAIATACQREIADWSDFVGSLVRLLRRTRPWRAALITALILLAAIFVPAPLKLAVDGRITATDSSRIYAPAEAVVTEVLVDDGQAVQAGDPLIRLRSPQLDLQQKTTAGLLAAARSRLDSLQVSRNARPTNARSTDRQSRSYESADEQMLVAEIEGLQSQLNLIQQQQAALLVSSPIAGRIDRWDLRNSLTARPVAVGQYLFKVVADDAGWQLRLAVPDQSIGYVTEQQQQRPCSVAARLRSDPTVVHQTAIDRIAASAQVDESGTSIVWATAPLGPDSVSGIRDGSTVLAEIDCGNHPIGLVWLRGLVQWWRSSTWF